MEIIENKEYSDKKLYEVYPPNEFHNYQIVNVSTPVAPGDYINFKDDYVDDNGMIYFMKLKYKRASYGAWRSETESLPQKGWFVTNVYCDIDGTLKPNIFVDVALEVNEYSFIINKIEYISIDYFDVDMGKEKLSLKCSLPYKVGTLGWNFPNFIFQPFAPKRERIDSYELIWGGELIRNWAKCDKWNVEKLTQVKPKLIACTSHYDEYINKPLGWHKDCRQNTLVAEFGDGKKYQWFYSDDEVKQIFADEDNFIRFAKETYAKCIFENITFNLLMEIIGRTMDDLNDASKKRLLKPKIKNNQTKKKKNETKVSKMFDNMTEEEKAEMLKLLNNESLLKVLLKNPKIRRKKTNN